MNKLISLLERLEIPYKQDVSAKKISTYKGGGIIRVMSMPSSIKHLRDIAKIISIYNFPYFIMGACSNVLVSDLGYDGLVISTAMIKGNTLTDSVFHIGAGERLSSLSAIAKSNSLSGLEPFSMIPATLGGAIFMNAGAFGKEIKDIVLSVSVFDIKESKIITLNNNDINFSYRSTGETFKNKIIVTARLKLSPLAESEIENKMLTLKRMRVSLQPLKPSLGSVFNNYNGLSAGFLVDESGLKGHKIGGAEISKKHANFIVNNGDGSALDYIKLSELMSESVEKRFGIKLKKEYVVLENP